MLLSVLVGLSAEAQTKKKITKRKKPKPKSRITNPRKKLLTIKQFLRTNDYPIPSWLNTLLEGLQKTTNYS